MRVMSGNKGALCIQNATLKTVFNLCTWQLDNQPECLGITKEAFVQLKSSRTLLCLIVVSNSKACYCSAAKQSQRTG